MTGTNVVAGKAQSRGPVVVRSSIILIVLVGSGICPAGIPNPGFEETKNVSGRLLPLSWIPGDHPSFNSYCTSLWCTEGQFSVGMWNRIGKAVVAGNSQGFYQSVDLTGIASIEFDVRLTAKPEGAFAHFEASLLIDGVVLWSRDTDGTYLNQKVEVSHRAGWHRLDIRNTAVEAGTFGAAYWTEWDNVRLVEGPKAVPAVIDLDPRTLHVHSPGKWVVCYIELPAGYDVNNIDETTVTLQEIPAYLGPEGHGVLALRKGKVTDHDRDGIPERVVRFDGDMVRALVQPPEATLTVKGNLTDKTPFEGSATIKVVDKLAELKARREELKAKAKDLRDKCNDEKDRSADLKDLRDKVKDVLDKGKDKDGKGAGKR